MDRLTASIIIPTYNKKERLGLVLESFNNQNEGVENYELIIVDDGSTDGTSELVKSFKPEYPLKYIRQENSGRSASRNRGVLASGRGLIIFCDDDLLVPGEFVSAHINAHVKNPGKVVHGMIYNLPYLKFFKNPATGELFDSQQEQGVNFGYLRKYLVSIEDLTDFANIRRQSKLSLFEKQVKSAFDREFTAYRWLGFTGGNVSCSRQQLLEAGLFDESFGRGWGCEDLELGFRLHLRGVEFVYSKEASNFHMAHYRAAFAEELKAAVRKFYCKHPCPVTAGLYALLSGEVKSIEEFDRTLRHGNEAADC